MKNALRSAAKRVFYRVYPALRVPWFLIKFVEYFFIHPALSLLPLCLAHRIFRLRWPWLLLMPSEKELILRNLSVAFEGKPPPLGFAGTAARYARFLSCLRFDAWISSSASAKKLHGSVRFEGLCHVREAQEQGKAVVLLGCHTGYFYRFVFALARNGYKHTVITMRTEETGRIVWRGRAELMLYRRILERMEGEENIRVIYAGRAYPAIRKSLEEKRILLTKIDNPLMEDDDKGVKVSFLGVPCLFSGRIFEMAKRHDAVCLPYIVKVEGHVCRIRIYPPRQQTGRETREDDGVSAQMEYFVRLFEAHVRACPEQWWLWRDLGAFGLPPSTNALSIYALT